MNNELEAPTLELIGEDPKLHGQRSSHSDERRTHRPDSIETSTGLSIVDLTRTSTDSSLQEELHGLTIHDLDTDVNDEGVSAIHQATANIPTSNSTIFPAKISVTVEAPSPTPPMVIPANRSIRFRSRVRITSGLHHKHRGRDLAAPNSDLGSLHPGGLLGHSEGDTTVSSRSSSPSSSISAPIRFREDEATVSSRWGPLGQRVQLFVSQQREKAKQAQADRETQARRRSLLVYGTDANSTPNFVDLPSNEHERTPLLGSVHASPRKSSAAAAPLGDDDDSDLYEIETESDFQARLNHEVDVIFGKWPRRLLNRHWWLWQIKPIVCCSYAEDWETEY